MKILKEMIFNPIFFKGDGFFVLLIPILNMVEERRDL